jgi:4-hydroxy-3-methylbut-2-enyl diphosphate reductase
MRIIRSKAMGMCFGVRDAIEKVMNLENPRSVTVYGQLVHNPEVLGRLEEKGFSVAEESGRSALPLQPRVVITAHGICDQERNNLLERGKALVDTTCPLVKRAHAAAQAFQSRGYFVVVVGKKDHVEVRGITGDLQDYDVVGNPDEVRAYDAEKIGVVSQTTTLPDLLEKVFRKIARRNFGKEIRLADTICRPTRDRQNALEELLEQVEAVVIVGGKNSNNTRQLAASAQAKGLPFFCVEKAGDLVPAWFAGLSTVGLTAGTSTLDETIEEVSLALGKMDSMPAPAHPMGLAS